MKNSYECLQAGLRESIYNGGISEDTLNFSALASLTCLASSLVEGDTFEKRWARARLQKLIGRGRCLLNAADLAARQIKGGAA